MLLPTTRLQSAGVSLLLASGCWLGVVPPGLADPPAEPAAVSAPASTLMTLEQVRTISALQEMGSLPSEEKTALRRVSLENSQLKDKGALKVLKSGQEYAARGADPETQTLDVEVLRKAEERFNLLVEDLAPSFSGGYANRANVRVALKDYAGAVEDYEMALRLSPLSDDAWVNWLNRGSTLIALGQPERALPDLQRSVELSKAAVASGANQAEQTRVSNQSQRNLEQSRVTSGDLGRRRSSRCSGAARRCTRSAGGRRPRPTTAPWSVRRPATCSPFGCGGDRLGPSARPRRPTDRPPASRIGTGSSCSRWAGRRTRSASCGASRQSSTSSQSASSPSMPRRTPRAASAALPRRSGCGVSRPAR